MKRSDSILEKIIRLSIENTTKIRRVEDSFCELYSHDKNNGAFEFEISKGTLTNENVVALFKFLRSGSYWKTTGTVEGNKIKFNFDTSLITQNEDVVCYIYLDKEERNSDIFRFKFKVNLSEIDKASQLPVKERYFANSMIVDRVDVLTKEDFEKALAEISKGSHFLTENQANEKYALKGDIPNVSNFVSSDQLSDYALKTEIPNSETVVRKAVEEVEKKNYLTEHQSLDGYVTETQLNEKRYLTEHQDISKLATKQAVDDVAAKVTQLEARPVTSSYDDSEIKRKIKELEDRPVTANIDTSNFVTTTQLEDKHYLTEHQSLEDYVTKNELRDMRYLTEHQDISGLATKEQLDELRNSQPTIDTSNFATKEQLRKAFLDDEEHEKYAKKSELPQPYNDTDIKSRLSTLENKPSGSGSELRGHGFPTGKDAPIGTTYIDEDVTNGALKWIKTKTGWKVIEGDTGWVDIVTSYMFTGSKIQLRRINNIVHVKVTNGTTEGLIRFNNLYDANTTTRYLKVFNGMASFGWRPTTPQVQIIFPEVTQGGDDYTYNTSTPQQYIRFRTDITGLKIELFLEEFAVTNNGLGVYINSFSYLTDDDWAIFITTIP
nr:MAG TPA: hypothetical protein [Caudoviricetes sp.]